MTCLNSTRSRKSNNSSNICTHTLFLTHTKTGMGEADVDQAEALLQPHLEKYPEVSRQVFDYVSSFCFIILSRWDYFDITSDKHRLVGLLNKHSFSH